MVLYLDYVMTFHVTNSELHIQFYNGRWFQTGLVHIFVDELSVFGIYVFITYISNNLERKRGRQSEKESGMGWVWRETGNGT